MSTEQSLQQYLSSLKAGDVVYRESGANSVDRVRIAKITRTQIVMATGGRYNLQTGVSIGTSSGWERSAIRQATPEIKAKWQRLYLASWATRTLPGIFKSLTAEQQAALYRQIKDMEAKNNGADADSGRIDADNETALPLES